MKIAFLDRDGTINRDYSDAQWRDVKAPEMLDGAVEAMRRFADLGYKIILITNQYTIGEGIISIEDYRRFTALLLDALAHQGVEVLDIFFCPHGRDEGCSCQKPRTGMIEDACRKYPGIDLTLSFFVGDSAADMELARRCGVKFYGIGLDCEHPIERLADMRRIRP